TPSAAIAISPPWVRSAGGRLLRNPGRPSIADGFGTDGFDVDGVGGGGATRCGCGVGTGPCCPWACAPVGFCPSLCAPVCEMGRPVVGVVPVAPWAAGRGFTGFGRDGSRMCAISSQTY